MEKELLSTKMKLEHGKMLALLNSWRKGEDNSLVQLKDVQGRHALAEEKAIMVFYKDKKDFTLLNTILEQHTMLRGFLSNMKSNSEIAEKFEKLMKIHIQIEDSKFYPMLDNELTPEEQEEMFKEFLVLFGQKMKS